MRPFARAGLVALVLAGALGASGAAEPAATFALRDHLGREWGDELVFFPVAEGLVGRDDLALEGPGGEAVAHQWVPAALAPSGEPCVAFLASVPRFGRSVYRLVEGRPVVVTDLEVSEGEGAVRLASGLAGIALRGTKARGAGPVAGIRLRSGRWVGGGELRGVGAPSEASLRVEARGPVFAQATAALGWPDGGHWRLRARVLAGQPVVLIEETFRLAEGAEHRLALGQGWAPDQMFYRDYHVCKLAKVASIPGDRLFLLEPWLRWWGERPRGTWTSLCEDGSEDLLAIGCLEPGLWRRPEKTQWPTAVPVAKDGTARFQLRGFARRWMLGSLRKSACVTDKKHFAPRSQQLLIQHGDVALDRVKDYVLEWAERERRHPRLFVTEEELRRFRASYEVEPGRLEQLRKGRFGVWQMDEPVAAFLATGDRELGRRIAELAMDRLQRAVDAYVRQERYPTQGTELHVHYNDVTFAVNPCDAALAPGVLEPEERRRVRAQLAYLAYTLASPAVCSPGRGYHANPNMTTCTRSALGVVACTIPDHPRAPDWAKLAIGEMRHELEHWCGPNGGWLEAPHYMTVSMDAIVALAVALRDSGLSEVDWAHHPKLRAAVAWLAKISTPPDPRVDGDRHMPAIGNTYTGERTCLPGWMARIWRRRDPAYARHMQWMWRAHGSPRTPGIGGAYPGVRGYTFLMFDEAIAPEAPPWGTELFPAAGAVFRAHFPGQRETYVHYIQGPMHQHYDYDEGSFILWGKGRPLCEDFGYYGRAPAADHSRVDDGVKEYLGNEGRIREFATSQGADYLRGERAGWCRQLLFVKDARPLGPNYLVVRDTLPPDRVGHWRVWVATDAEPDLAANPIRLRGCFDVDLVVYFAAPPEPRLSTATLTRRTGASGFQSRETTQRSIHVAMAPGQPVAAVLYPLLRRQPTPRFTALAGGRGVRIEGDFGSDVAFLAREPFAYRGGGVAFRGVAGAVQARRDGQRLNLPLEGRVRAGEREIEHGGGEAPAASRWFPE
ncbi:MAG: hypothetical protein ACLF0G_10385 [Candidatus Brocadiia bacterium]